MFHVCACVHACVYACVCNGMGGRNSGSTTAMYNNACRKLEFEWQKQLGLSAGASESHDCLMAECPLFHAWNWKVSDGPKRQPAIKNRTKPYHSILQKTDRNHIEFREWKTVFYCLTCIIYKLHNLNNKILHILVFRHYLLFTYYYYFLIY